MKAYRNITIAAALIGAAAFTCTNAYAAGSPEPTTSPPSQAQPPAAKKATPKKSTGEKKAPEKKSEQDFIRGYHQAYDLIYRDKNYTAGIAALRELHHDDNADVANLLGFSSRKLGNYDEAKYWYEKSLVADPNHTRTWQYYGMWQIEQGNRLKAEEYLAKIENICGTECEDYKTLKLALAGNMNY